MKRPTHENRRAGKPKASPLNGERGFILIAAVALLATLLGVVMLCLHPLTWEANQVSRHREALRRMKATEQGILGRLADQPGGQYSACGGYLSDLGAKMIVAEVADAVGTGGDQEGWFLLDFWYFRRSGALPVLNQQTATSFAIISSPVSSQLKYGLTDIYRYDLQNGFWVGYRGKGYIKRPIGEEHMRRDYATYADEVPSAPLFKDGFMGWVYFGGVYGCSEVFLETTVPNIDPYKYDGRLLEHRRYYNPVEKLVVRLHDHRAVPTPLTARLIYAKQPDKEIITDLAQLVPQYPSKVVVESPRQRWQSGSDTTFVFVWEPTATSAQDTDFSGVDRAHTFEVGLKKLVLLENGVPVFAWGIAIPPVRDYQCRPKNVYPCVQPYYDQYVVEVDYDG